MSYLGQDCPALIPDCLPSEGGRVFRLQGPPGCRHICFFVGLFQLSAFYQQSSCDKLVRSPFSLVSPHACVVQFSARMVSCQSGLHFILVIECIAFRPASTCSPALIQPSSGTPVTSTCFPCEWNQCLSTLNKFCFFSNFVKAQGWTLYMWLYL